MPLHQSIVACLAGAVLVQTHAVGAQLTTRIEAPPGGVTVPMKSLGGRPIVDVTINGDANLMLLDTGASGTVIDPERLGGGETGPAVVKELGIGALTLRDLGVRRQPLLRPPNPSELTPVGV